MQLAMVKIDSNMMIWVILKNTNPFLSGIYSIRSPNF